MEVSMISSSEFIRQSLELHLFFMRIMKEHSFFLQVGFIPKDSNLMHQANAFRMEFDRLLSDVICLADGNVSQGVLQSGEVVTPYTLKAEMASAYLTGVNIPTSLTEAEIGLMGNNYLQGNPMLEERVYMVNERAMKLVAGLIQFKAMILSEVNTCRLFTVNYPLLIDHIMREAKLYLALINKLQMREETNIERFAYEQEAFWNRIMAEHAKFISGLLDPTEVGLKELADNFGREFDELTKEAIVAMERTLPLGDLTEDSLNATMEIRNFKRQGTQGLLECKIKSIIIPLLGDHTLREASHFLRLLNIFDKNIRR